MTLDDMTLDITQSIESDSGDVFRSVLHRLSDGSTNPTGEPMQMILEQWPGGRWFRIEATASGTCGDTCR